MLAKKGVVLSIDDRAKIQKQIEAEAAQPQNHHSPGNYKASYWRPWAGKFRRFR